MKPRNYGFLACFWSEMRTVYTLSTFSLNVNGYSEPCWYILLIILDLKAPPPSTSQWDHHGQCRVTAVSSVAVLRWFFFSHMTNSQLCRRGRTAVHWLSEDFVKLMGLLLGGFVSLSCRLKSILSEIQMAWTITTAWTAVLIYPEKLSKSHPS